MGSAIEKINATSARGYGVARSGGAALTAVRVNWARRNCRMRRMALKPRASPRS